MHRSIARFLLLSTLLAAASSCGDDGASPSTGNVGPTIQTIEGPGEFRIEGDFAKVDLTITWTDAEGDRPSKIHFKITDLRGSDKIFDLDPPQVVGNTVLFTFGLESKLPKYKYRVEFSLIDARGAEGTKLIKEIQMH
jgi:hypothetical protein